MENFEINPQNKEEKKQENIEELELPNNLESPLEEPLLNPLTETFSELEQPNTNPEIDPSLIEEIKSLRLIISGKDDASTKLSAIANKRIDSKIFHIPEIQVEVKTLITEGLLDIKNRVSTIHRAPLIKASRDVLTVLKLINSNNHSILVVPDIEESLSLAVTLAYAFNDNFLALDDSFDPENILSDQITNIVNLPKYGIYESVDSQLDASLEIIISRRANRADIERAARVWSVDENELLPMVKKRALNLIEANSSLDSFRSLVGEFGLGLEYLTSPDVQIKSVKEIKSIKQKLSKNYYGSNRMESIASVLEIKQTTNMSNEVFLEALEMGGVIETLTNQGSYSHIKKLLEGAEKTPEQINEYGEKVLLMKMMTNPTHLPEILESFNLSKDILKKEEILTTGCAIIVEKLSAPYYNGSIENKTALDIKCITSLIEMLNIPTIMLENALALGISHFIQTHSGETYFIEPLLQEYPSIQGDPRIKAAVRQNILAQVRKGDFEYKLIDLCEILSPWTIDSDEELKLALDEYCETKVFPSQNFSHPLHEIVELCKTLGYTTPRVTENGMQNIRKVISKDLNGYGQRDTEKIIEAIRLFNIEPSEIEDGLVSAISSELNNTYYSHGIDSLEARVGKYEEDLSFSKEYTKELILKGIELTWTGGQFHHNKIDLDIFEDFFSKYLISSEDISKSALQAVVNLFSKLTSVQDDTTHFWDRMQIDSLIEHYHIDNQHISSQLSPLVARSFAPKILSEKKDDSENVEDILYTENTQELPPSLPGCYYANILDLMELITEFNLSQNISEYPWEQEAGKAVLGFINAQQIKDWQSFTNEYSDNFELIANVHKKDGEWPLTPEQMTKSKSHGLSTHEAFICAQEGIVIEGMSYETLWEKIILACKNSDVSNEWQDDEICKHFELGKMAFGVPALMRFMGRPNLSRHDALLAITDVIKLQENSGISTEAFSRQILSQVAMDNADYSNGTANHHFNALVNRGFRPLNEVKRIIEGYEPNVQIQCNETLSAFQTNEDIFSSWRTLKSYYEKVDTVINGIDRLRQISQLRDEGKEKLADWFSIVSSSANVETQALVEFLAEPKTFLNRTASYTDSEIQAKMKPGNYAKVDNLDLSSEELRDALIEGHLDSLQSLPPFVLKYRVAPEGKVCREGLEQLDTITLIKTVLGSRRGGIPGFAAGNGKRLYGQLREIIKTEVGEDVYDVPDLISGAYTPSPEADRFFRDAALEALDPSFLHPGVEYVAAIYAKSSPHGVLAGNDTACCMPFGDGKANEYMFNPACAQFVLQEERENGSRRTLVQSVMTLNVNVHENVTNALSDFNQQSGDGDITRKLPEEILAASPRTVVADSAETNPNFMSNPAARELTETLYADFFFRYFEGLIETQSIDTSQVLIGSGDVLSHLPKVPNTTFPVAPVSYSDNLVQTSGQLTPIKNITGRLAVKVEVSMPFLKSRKPQQGISDLTFEDSLQTTYLEGKAYADNPSLVVGLHKMQNTLIAKDIANDLKDRANFSFKYVDSKGILQGYLVAYEGRKGIHEYNEFNSSNNDTIRDREDLENDRLEAFDVEAHRGANTSIEPRWNYTSFDPALVEANIQNHERVIYIFDLAARKRSVMAGGRLMNQFMDVYKKNYLDKNDLIPIYLEARESTSYQILTNQLNAIGRRYGIQFTTEILNTTHAGQDKMYEILIRPNLNTNEPALQEPLSDEIDDEYNRLYGIYEDYEQDIEQRIRSKN